MQCHRLRLLISRAYKLEHFDLFFVPSLHIARVILSQLFLRQESTYSRSRQDACFPASELNAPLHYPPGLTGTFSVIDHVDRQTGTVRALTRYRGRGIIDASQTFATLRHSDLVQDGQLFITSLGEHASLTSALCLVALRTSEFSTLMRSELRLFESAMINLTAVDACLQRMESSSWQPYNVAQIEQFQLDTPLSLRSIGTPRLPFSAIPLAPEWGTKIKIPLTSGCYSAADAMLRLTASVRGDGRQGVDRTDEIIQRVRQLISAVDSGHFS